MIRILTPFNTVSSLMLFSSMFFPYLRWPKMNSEHFNDVLAFQKLISCILSHYISISSCGSHDSCFSNEDMNVWHSAVDKLRDWGCWGWAADPGAQVIGVHRSLMIKTFCCSSLLCVHHNTRHCKEDIDIQNMFSMLQE